MKIALQAFEPLQRPFGQQAAEIVATPKARKPRLMLNPVGNDLPLFHAWRG